MAKDNEKGAVLIVTVIFMPVALAFLMLIVDEGQLLVAQRKAVLAADAAALALVQSCALGQPLDPIATQYGNLNNADITILDTCAENTISAKASVYAPLTFIPGHNVGKEATAVYEGGTPGTPATPAVAPRTVTILEFVKITGPMSFNWVDDTPLHRTGTCGVNFGAGRFWEAGETFNLNTIKPSCWDDLGGIPPDRLEVVEPGLPGDCQYVHWNDPAMGQTCLVKWKLNMAGSPGTPAVPGTPAEYRLCDEEIGSCN